MEAELSTQCTLSGSLSNQISDKENYYKKSLFNNDDQEMLNFDVREVSNEVSDVQYQGNADNFQIVPQEKLSFLNGQFTKYSKLENNKRCLQQKQLVHSGLAGDLTTPWLHHHIPYKTKCCKSEYLSQPIQSFSDTPFADKSNLKALPISKFNEKNTVSENKNNSLVFLATNRNGLKEEISARKVSQSGDQNGNCHDVMMDKPGTEKRTVPESYVNLITNKAKHLLIQKNKTDSIQEVPEAYCYSDAGNEKWKSIQKYIKEQQLIYHGSAGDLISAIHVSNAYFPEDMKKILESSSQPRASPNEDFIHEIKYDSNVCISERIMFPQTAATINDKAKIAAEHGIPKINHISAINDVVGSKQSIIQNCVTGLVQIKSQNLQIQSEMFKITSKINNNSTFDSLSFAAEGSPGKNCKWKDMEKYLKEQHYTYSGLAGELISCTSGMHIYMPQMGDTTLSSLFQPTEYQKIMLGCKSNFKVFRELPFSLKYSACNTITEYDEIMLSNKTTENHDVILKATDEELTETTASKVVCRNDTNQSCDVLNNSRKYNLTGLNSYKILQERLDSIEDQTVPNRVQTVDYEIDECPYIVHNSNSPRDASDNSECKRLSPEVFAENDDDISLFSDSSVNAENEIFNTDMKETQNALNSEDKSVQKNESAHEFLSISHMHPVNDTLIHKLSQNVLEQLEPKESKKLSTNNAEINDFNSRVEKKINSIAFEEESLLEDADCLYASDVLPICLTQPAVPTYLLRNNKSELSKSSFKAFKTDIKIFETRTEQYHKEKAKNTTDSINLNSSSENEKTPEASCKSTMSKITSCTTPISSTSLCYQNPLVLLCDSDNSQQKTFFSASRNCNATIQGNICIQKGPQNEKNQLEDQLHKSRMCETESKEVNAKNKPPCNKNVHSNANVHLSPMLENCHKAELQNLKDYPESVSNLEKQTHTGKTDTGYLNTKPSNDRQTNEIIPVKNISRFENCTNATENICHSNPILLERSVMEENKCCSEISTNVNSSLTQHRSSNERYLDIAKNLCNEYSLSSAKPLKSERIITYLKEEDCNEKDDHADSSEEEYDTDVSISEVASESNIDLHIDHAIEKYQNASSGSENTLIPGSQHMINTLEASVQTDIFGLVQVKQCMCKAFNFCCELCNQNSPKLSENMEKKRHAASFDSEMPLNKKAKCYGEKILMNSSTNTETENKMQVGENIKYPEDINTLSQVSFFNKRITPPHPASHDYKHSSEYNKEHRDIQGVYKRTQLFSWYTLEKSKPSQRPQEVNEPETQQKSKQRVPLRIGLSKRAKTKPLHYSYN